METDILNLVTNVLCVMLLKTAKVASFVALFLIPDASSARTDFGWMAAAELMSAPV